MAHPLSADHRAGPPPGADEAPAPFAGLRVIDCASYIAAPAAAAMLADFGADVIKLEPPEGDPQRGLYRLPGTPPACSNYGWDLDARGKRSLVLDLKRPEGRAVLHRLVAQADVFVTNLPLAVRGRLAIDHARLLALNPRLVYASMTAYGERGPEAGKGGFDVTAYWARSGLMDMVRADHQSPPTRPVGGMGDHPSAAALFGGIAAALYRRERTGRGGLVSSSLLANGLWANALQVQAHLTGGVVYPPRQGRHLAPNPLSNIYQCRDGRWLSLVMLNEARQLPALWQVLGLSHLADDPRFATQAAREAHAAEMVAALDHGFAMLDLAEWRVRLDAAGITFGVVGTLADLDHDEQARASGALVPFASSADDAGADGRTATDGHAVRGASDGHASRGARGGAAGLTVASPLQFDGQPQPAPRPAPALGAHSAELLREAGFEPAEIDRLCRAGVVGTPARPGPATGAVTAA